MAAKIAALQFSASLLWFLPANNPPNGFDGAEVRATT
jgi:hypothetical protein